MYASRLGTHLVVSSPASASAFPYMFNAFSLHFSCNHLFFLLHHRFTPESAYTHGVMKTLLRRPALIPLCPCIHCPFLCPTPTILFTAKLRTCLISSSSLYSSRLVSGRLSSSAPHSTCSCECYRQSS